jgi:hypothetical protein
MVLKEERAMTPSLKDIFAESERPSLAVVADAVAVYAYNRKLREEDHQVVGLLTENGFKQDSYIHPDDVLPGNSQQDKAVYRLIGQVMDSLVKNETVNHDDLCNLKAYAAKKSGSQFGWRLG